MLLVNNVPKEAFTKLLQVVCRDKSMIPYFETLNKQRRPNRILIIKNKNILETD